MRPVFGFGVAGDQDVVDVDESEIQASEDLVHEPLERLCRILKAERHAEKLPQTERGDDGRLGDVVCVHWDLVVATNQINLREDPCPCQVGREVLYMWDWVAVRRRGIV